MTTIPHPLTVERISLAVVAAAKAYGDDPALAISSQGKLAVRRSLAPACLGLANATGQTVLAVSRVLACDPTSVSRAKRSPTPLFKIAAEAAEAAVRLTLPNPQPPAPPSPPAPQRAPAPPGPLEPRPSRQPGPVVASANLAHHRAYAPPAARPELTAARAEAAGAGRVLDRTVSIGRTIEARRMSRVVRMLPVTDEKLRYSRWFLAAGWDLEDVAGLFDVSADSLALAVERQAA